MGCGRSRPNKPVQPDMVVSRSSLSAERDEPSLGRQKQSAHSKRLPPEATKFIEVIEQTASHSTGADIRKSSGDMEIGRATSRETQKTDVSSVDSNRLPPLPRKRTRFRPTSSLPNVVATPTDYTRPTTATRASSRRRSLELPSPDEIIAHRRHNSLDSITIPPIGEQKKVSVTNSQSPLPPFRMQPLDNSSLSDSTSFIVVHRRIKVAWEGPRQSGNQSDDAPRTGSDEDSTSASCSTCDQRKTSAEGSKNTPSDNVETFSSFSESVDSSLNGKKLSRRNSALSRGFYKLRQFSLPPFHFQRKQQQQNSSNVSQKTKDASGKKDNRQIFRSRTFDFMAIQKCTQENIESPRSEERGSRFRSRSREGGRLSWTARRHLTRPGSSKCQPIDSKNDRNGELNDSDSISDLDFSDKEADPMADCAAVHHDFFNDFENLFDEELFFVDDSAPVPQLMKTSASSGRKRSGNNKKTNGLESSERVLKIYTMT